MWSGSRFAPARTRRVLRRSQRSTAVMRAWRCSVRASGGIRSPAGARAGPCRPRPQRGGVGRALDRARPCDQHFEVVDAAEQVLRAFQRHNARAWRATRSTRERSPWHIAASSRRSGPRAAGPEDKSRRRSRCWRQAARLAAPRGRGRRAAVSSPRLAGRGAGRVVFSGRGQQLLAQLVEVGSDRSMRRMSCACATVPAPIDLLQRGDARARHIALTAEFLQRQQGHVELADGPERARQRGGRHARACARTIPRATRGSASRRRRVATRA